jgi:hypothetical protein
MRRSALAALLATMVLTWPVQAQAQGTAQTLLDTTLAIRPTEIPAMCLEPGAGTLTVQTDVPQPPRAGMAHPMIFAFNSVKVDPSEHATFTIGSNGSVETLKLAGTGYCWHLGIDPSSLPPTTPTMSDAELGALVQTVHLKLTFTPQ